MASSKFGLGVGNPVKTRSLSTPSAMTYGLLGTCFCAALAGFLAYLNPPEPNTLMAVVIGILVGGLAGTAIIRRVPLKVQLTGLGAVLGMGLDELTNIAQGNAPQTAIHALARLVKQTVEAVVTDLPPIGSPDPAAWALGMWVGLGTIAVVLLFGLLPGDVQ